MAQRQIGAVLEQVDDLVAAVQFQLDIRVALAKPADQRHQHMQHERCRGIDPQSPGRMLQPARHLLLGLLHRVENPPRLAQERRALLRQLQTAGGAAQQRGRELGFEPAQRTTNARSGLPELYSGTGDGAGVDHRSEGLQLVERRFH